MKKRILAMFLALCIALTVLPISTSAVEDGFIFDGGDAGWAPEDVFGAGGVDWPLENGSCVRIEDVGWPPEDVRPWPDDAAGGEPAQAHETPQAAVPDEQPVTYGEFINALVQEFYPEELARAGKEGAQYAPAIQVAANRQLKYNTMDSLMSLRDYPINRYNASWILVRILADKGVVLPDDQERAAAANAIRDWDALREEAYWRYFVSSIYALGIMSAADETGAFCGEKHITQADAADIYGKMASKLKISGNEPKAFRLILEGDWSTVPKEYREALEEEFYTVYPRLWARFGTAATTKHISLELVPKEEISGNAGLTIYSFDNTRYQRVPKIKIDRNLVSDWRPSAAVFAHELTHAAMIDTRIKIKEGTWLFECLADYGIFRYAAWTDERYMWIQESYYQPEEEALRTWDYEAYTDTHWFFAYMDFKYPTTSVGYGMLDSLLLAIRNGQVATDGGKNQDDRDLNAVVKEATGYDGMNALRQRYIEELNGGTWSFNGFVDYRDNFITENLPGVPNPAYLTASDFNLCANARITNDPGEDSAALAASNLIDGNRSTKWAAAKGGADGPGELYPDVKRDIVIRLDKAVIFDTYVLYHEGSRGNSAENTRAWRIRYYDEQAEKWVVFDEVQDNTQDVTSRSVDPVKAKWLWLEILEPSGTGDGTVRLYELEVYRKGASGGASAPGGRISIHVDPKFSADSGNAFYTTAGAVLTIHAFPDPGCQVESIQVVGANGNDVPLSRNGNDFSFAMPSCNVAITAQFIKEPLIKNLYS